MQAGAQVCYFSLIALMNFVLNVGELKQQECFYLPSKENASAKDVYLSLSVSVYVQSRFKPCAHG